MNAKTKNHDFYSIEYKRLNTTLKIKLPKLLDK